MWSGVYQLFLQRKCNGNCVLYCIIIIAVYIIYTGYGHSYNITSIQSIQSHGAEIVSGLVPKICVARGKRTFALRVYVLITAPLDL